MNEVKGEGSKEEGGKGRERGRDLKRDREREREREFGRI